MGNNKELIQPITIDCAPNNNLQNYDTMQNNKLEDIKEAMIQGNKDTIKKYTVDYEKKEIEATFKTDTQIINTKVNIVGDGIKEERYLFPRSMPKEQLSKNIRVLRDQGETQERVAEILETNQTKISNEENGK